MKDFLKKIRERTLLFNLPIDGGGDGGGGGETGGTPTIGALKATASSAKTSIQITFIVNDITNVSSIKIYRSMDANFSNAVAISTVVTSLGNKSYDDADAAIQLKRAYYWVVIGFSGSSTQSKFGSVTATLEPSLPTYSPDFFDASHDKVLNAVLRVCGVVKNNAASSFGSVRVYAKNYRGNPNYVRIHQSSKERFNFFMEATGEIVTLKASVLASDGFENPASYKETNLLLGNEATKPNRVSDIQAACASSGVQFEFPASMESEISEYRLYRVARGGDAGSAALINSVAATDEDTITMYDPDGDAVSYQWYITAVNGAGESAKSDAVYDPTPF